jgi:hypothetical protein
MRFRPSSLLRLVFLLALMPVASATTWYVNGVSGSDSNNCLSVTSACQTIGHAISLSASGDLIKIAAATYKENLTIGKSLNIFGSGAPTTIIDGGGVGTVVTILSNKNAHVALANLTIRHGLAGTKNGGGIWNGLGSVLMISNTTISGNGASNGGGIFNQGTLTINNSTISGNDAIVLCTQFCASSGGGIYNSYPSGTVTVTKSTISGNMALMAVFTRFPCRSSCLASGGGISNHGTLTINNSTISGNGTSVDAGCSQFCNGSGGGVDNSGKTLKINNSTISGNRVYKLSGCLHVCFASGGGVSGTAALQNSIVANNPSGGNCYGTMTSHGYNLSSDATCAFNGPGDMNNTNPMLDSLNNNGGPTQTMALLSGSPAIDAGNPSGCTDSLGHLLKTDQRGMPRPDTEDTGGCDMGAYERQSD